MPSFTSQVGDLGLHGPLVEIFVAIPKGLAEQLQKTNKPVPPPLKAIAMIDTGAQLSVLSPTIVAALQLTPVGYANMVTPSTTTPMTTSQHLVDIVFQQGITAANVVAIQGTLVGQNIQALIGRDVLKHGVLIYTGYINQFTLSF